MSCWETSTFLPNQKKVKVSLLKEACLKLGWKIETSNSIITVLDANQNTNLYGEYALKVIGNEVNYNTYYMNNGKEKLTELQEEYMKLFLPDLVKTIQNTFKKVGYSILENQRFRATADKYNSFFVVATSKQEEGIKGKIKFTILTDGTVETDSEYIPEDIHELADQAMENLEEALMSERRIEPKPRHLIPASQRNKVHCNAKKTIKLKH